MTPNTANVSLPPSQNYASNPPTKGSTPAPDRGLPPHLANRAPQSNATSPPPAASGNGKDSPAPDSPTSTKLNGAGSAEKAEREKAKKKEKKERKDRERAEKAEREKAETPKPESAVPASVSAADSLGKTESEGGRESPREELKSPVTDAGSGGLRTPKLSRPPRNPWTIFMRMQVQATEPEVREFFGEAASGVCLHFPFHVKHPMFMVTRLPKSTGQSPTRAGHAWHILSLGTRRP